MSTLSVDTIQGKTTAGTVAMPSGMTVQTVYNNYTTQTVISNSGSSPVGPNTFFDTGLTCSITPKFSTSKIYVLLSQQLRMNDSSGYAEAGVGYKFFRDSTAIYTTNTNYATYIYHNDTAEQDWRGWQTLVVLDSPSSTSSLTYKVQLAKYGDGYLSAQDNSNQSSLTLMEIKQ